MKEYQALDDKILQSTLGGSQSGYLTDWRLHIKHWPKWLPRPTRILIA